MLQIDEEGAIYIFFMFDNLGFLTVTEGHECLQVKKHIRQHAYSALLSLTYEVHVDHSDVPRATSIQQHECDDAESVGSCSGNCGIENGAASCVANSIHARKDLEACENLPKDKVHVTSDSDRHSCQGMLANEVNVSDTSHSNFDDLQRVLMLVHEQVAFSLCQHISDLNVSYTDIKTIVADYYTLFGLDSDEGDLIEWIVASLIQDAVLN
jgi:hypothetical protein